MENQIVHFVGKIDVAKIVKQDLSRSEFFRKIKNKYYKYFKHREEKETDKNVKHRNNRVILILSH